MVVRHNPIDPFMHRVDRRTVLRWVGVERVTSQKVPKRLLVHPVLGEV
jgi:hypothetical protein